MFFLKFLISPGGGHCDRSPREPKNLATPLATIKTADINTMIVYTRYKRLRGTQTPAHSVLPT